MSDPTKRDGASDDFEMALDEVLEEAAESRASHDPPLAEAQLAAKEAEQRALRAQAELENVRKRMRREQQEERRYALLPLIRDLLPAIDNLERALESVDTSSEDAEAAEATGLAEGVKMVAAQITDILGQHECSRIDPLGEPFDPMKHEAVAQQPSDEYPQGTVMQVLQVGYLLHDRVVRPAHVMVSQGAPGGGA